MEFRNPNLLWLLLVIIPMVAYYIMRERRRKPSIRFTDIKRLRSINPGLRTRLIHLPFILRITGIALLVIALARPRSGNEVREVTTHGVDIMLLLDISTSMKALDFKPKNRLHVAKERIKEFIKKREHDRIGLVAFAARSMTKCPLTLDYTILTNFLEDLDFGDIKDGTAIGTAIATGAKRLDKSDAKSRIMILLTDGENNAGEISPEVAAQAVAELGIKIYTIGIGKKGRVPYPVKYVDPRTNRVVKHDVKMMKSKLNEESLQEIADITGGMFFRAQDSKALQEIYSKINEMEKSDIETKSYTTYTEKFFTWLLAGCILIFIEILLSHTILRRVP